jgi:hypothetical protein
VGAKQWDTSGCENGICTIQVHGYDGSAYTEGYLNSGDIPTFKIYDASENAYFDAIPSADIPWSSTGFDLIESLIADGNGSDITDGCDLPDFNLYLSDDGSGSVLYNSSEAIAGFQFNVDGATVSSGSGGAAQDAGFAISTSGSTVLAFSFSGATITDG